MLRHMRATARFTDRRGAILIVVLAMLALFAIVGITFVMVASASAEKQRIKRDAQANDNGPAITDDGTNAFTRFIATLLYDEPDDATGLQNSLRGHSLADNMYGRYIQLPSGLTFSAARPSRGTASATSPRRPPPPGSIASSW